MRLVWDTSSLNLSMAVFSEDKCLFYRDDFRDKHQQSKLLFRNLSECLADGNLKVSDIQELGVGIGPGSYTGLRVGITLAKTWSFAKGLPCFSFRSDLALQRTQEHEADAIYPKVRFLQTSDLSLVKDLNDLKPLYHNDHFA